MNKLTCLTKRHATQLYHPQDRILNSFFFSVHSMSVRGCASISLLLRHSLRRSPELLYHINALRNYASISNNANTATNTNTNTNAKAAVKQTSKAKSTAPDLNRRACLHVLESTERIKNLISNSNETLKQLSPIFFKNIICNKKFKQNNEQLINEKLKYIYTQIETGLYHPKLDKDVKSMRKSNNFHKDLLTPVLDKASDLIVQVMKRENESKLQPTIDGIILQLLYNELKPYLYYHTYNDPANNENFSKNMTLNVVDINNPYEWYPETRKLKRKFILHMGPTNSGKTFNALKRLESCSKGYFAGPLRLLAREVYDKFQKKNIRCNLVTGEEVITDIDEYGNKAGLTSGTIEMLSHTENYDVVVVDEIQMINDSQRGFAWTNAILGAKAKEVHVCGEPSVLPLIKTMLKETGDDMEVHFYDRLNGLEVADEPIKNYKDLRKGDAVIAFGRKGILTLKHDIEKQTDLKCAMIYGGLPPETRAQEASKFNAGEYDIVLATDAIGMGLNLSINRVVFTTILKFDGKDMSRLSVSQTKQISGRAGRYGHQDKAPGIVTAFSSDDIDYIKYCLKQPYTILDKAMLWPIENLLVKYVSMFPKSNSLHNMYNIFESDIRQFYESKKSKKMSSIERKIQETDEKHAIDTAEYSSLSDKKYISPTDEKAHLLSEMFDPDNIFQLASFDDVQKTTKFFETQELNKNKGFNILDQMKIAMVPYPINNQGLIAGLISGLLKDVIQSVINREKSNVLQYNNMPLYLLAPETGVVSGNASRRFQGSGSAGKILPADVAVYADKLSKLEEFHKLLSCLLWLSYRYPENFVDIETTFKVKEIVEFNVSDMIAKLRATKKK